MMTALLLTFSQKPLDVANDECGSMRHEGRHFPAYVHSRPAKRLNLSAWAGRFALVLAVIGTALLGLGTAEWTFHPSGVLQVKTAALHFTLPIGVKQ